jgi:adenylate cyclase
MSRLSKAIILGFLTGMVGLAVGHAPFGLDLEENIGLDLLFTLRGARQPPPDVLVVSIDQKSAEKLNVSKDSRKWPRSLHARLIEHLVKEGATVIAFDLIFDEMKSPKENNLFTEAIRKAHNVVLCESLKREKVPLTTKGGSPGGNLNIEKLVQPVPPLAQSAIALAPFPLPKLPIKVSQYWTFKTEAGDTPTLPVVVFQIFGMQVYEEFVHLLEKASPSKAEKLPRSKEGIITTRGVENVIREIRDIFEDEPLITKSMLKDLQKEQVLSADPKKIQMLKSLIRMYQSPNSSYLNFYGPPGTINTIPYYQVLQIQEKGNLRQKQFDFSEKVVFVGLSERFPLEQRDGFHTVFSESSGLDISGVEIAATAFANLLEDRPVQPLSFWAHFITILLWGVVMGMVCYLFPTFIASMSALGLMVLYFIVATYQFKTTGNWYPLIVPLLIQSVPAFFSAVVWKSIELNKERQNIRKALQSYLPDRVVDQLSKNIADFKASKQLVYGICLYTDAEQYTSLSETMDPVELSNFMNRYYEALFKPIKQHGGIVSNIVGDAALAIWMKEQPDPVFRDRACHAALDIAKAVGEFNQSSGASKLPTRIGLHSGRVLLGNIGAIDHYEYHPIGDIVNTASRIEGLNKYLGTRILVSEEVIEQLDGFLTRKLGRFLLVGKKKPLAVYELVCRMVESNEGQRSRCAFFDKVLDAFRRRSWEEAMEKLHEYINIFGEDGPSLLYLKLCEQYRKNPPGESWDGVIQVANK